MLEPFSAGTGEGGNSAGLSDRIFQVEPLPTAGKRGDLALASRKMPRGEPFDLAEAEDAFQRLGVLVEPAVHENPAAILGFEKSRERIQLVVGVRQFVAEKRKLQKRGRQQCRRSPRVDSEAPGACAAPSGDGV
jgi:hypothetical protein